MFAEGAFKILLVCLVAVLVVSGNAENAGFTRIVNGEIITVDKTPYIVQIRNSSDDAYCGGTLVTPQHVVTAAHCVDLPQSHLKHYSVMAGVSTRSEKAERRQLAEVFIHPMFSWSSLDHDVAVIKLDEPLVETENIQIMRELCSEELEKGTLIQVSGWGHLYYKGPDSQELRTIRVPVLSPEECVGKIGKSMAKMCAYAPGTDACQNDSGGPGVHNDQLCAIVSHGDECAKKDAPGVYTNVHAVRDFINEKIKS